MKSTFTLFTMLAMHTFLASQISFNDNFDSYPANAYIAASNPKWTTWSNKPGTGEDAKVSSEQSFSAPNSLKIISTSASGGTTDLVLPFGGKYTSGHFTYGSAMLIPNGKNAYFNFQATQTIGQTWTLDVNFASNGTVTFSRSSAPLLTIPYPTAKWFDLQIVVNLTSNIWKVLINGECKGSFSNSNNSSIASMDFYPTDASSLYYVDDVRFSYDPSGAGLALDGSMSEFTWTKGKISGTSDTPTVALKNNGTTIITDADIVITTATGVIEESVSGVSLTKGQKTVLSLPEITLQPGQNTIDILLKTVNGLPSDEESCNNKYTFLLNAPVPAQHKAVLVEEGTGTWCQWCPRGAVFMDRYDEFYHKLFIPIAVHNGSSDPMLNAEYNSFMAFTAFPNAKVNRGAEMDPSATEAPFLTDISKAPIARLIPGATYDPVTRKLDVSVQTEFLSNASGDYYVSLILTEDGVKGTTTGYNQANAYAGGNNGVMGGFEALPNPVPAANMVYNHVARAVSGLKSAPANTFSGPFSAGSKKVLNYSFTLAPTWKSANMHIIPVLMKGTAYQNATTASIDDALANGFISGSEDLVLSSSQVTVYPNPSDDMTGIHLSMALPGNVTSILYSIDGQILYRRDYGRLDGEMILPVQTETLSPGMYLLEIITPSGRRIEKLQVSR